MNDILTRKPIAICIDDEEMVLESLQMELSECLGEECDIEVAQSGKEAVTLVRELMEKGEHVAVVICDYIMPEMKGDETLIGIHNIQPNIVSIMLTGQSSTDGITNAINNANLYRFVNKPWQGAHLSGIVREALGKYKSSLSENASAEALEAVSGENAELKALREILEKEVGKRTQDLLETNISLQQSNDELNNANKLKIRLLSVVSHDLKNPLAAIRSLAEILTMESKPDIQREIVDMMQSTVERMLNLIKDLLDTAALEMGQMKLYPLHRSVKELVEAICFDYAHAAEAKGQGINIEAAHPFLADIDERRFRQVLENLISNAVKYSPKNTTITVRFSDAENNMMRIAIQDEGPGITHDDKEKMFQFFQRLSAQPTGGESSTGVGLAIVKQIVELHNGKLWVESSPETGAIGSTFFVEIPLHQPSVSLG
ncbi:MAG: hybrid sensor histidine kinase/response regulator [Candidatus Kapaibacterium sp.]|nr:MAG: hybrid sensor histidine kinase/response regulator [Candidatus Kapabacteria bacterium]